MSDIGKALHIAEECGEDYHRDDGPITQGDALTVLADEVRRLRAELESVTHDRDAEKAAAECMCLEREKLRAELAETRLQSNRDFVATQVYAVERDRYKAHAEKSEAELEAQKKDNAEFRRIAKRFMDEAMKFRIEALAKVRFLKQELEQGD